MLMNCVHAHTHKVTHMQTHSHELRLLPTYAPSPVIPRSQWRARKEFKHDVVRACPECRLHSDFIVPSSYWFEDEKEKEEFISGERGGRRTQTRRD